MASSTTKKVLIKRFDREPMAGYVNVQAWLRPNGVELLTPDGGFAVIPYEEIKAVHFVRDFDSAGQIPEQKVFNNRPKIDGLWVRMRFRDGEVMEGVLPNNLLQLETSGFTVTPPEPYSNNQRVFIPRPALAEVQVLGVVGSPLRQPRKPKPAPKEQFGLFDQ